MTTLAEHPLVCAICGRESLHYLAASPNIVEPPDFDTRPGETLRSTLPAWVVECPHCGYAAADLSVADARASAIVRGEEYQHRRADPALPETARRFAAHAFLLERIGECADAGWTALHAAWMCDDLAHPGAARHCRSEAIRLWKRAKAQGEDFMEDLAQEFALVTDLLRRMGDFDAAREACLEALTLEDLPAMIDDMLRRQLTLIQQKDTAAHSLKELERPRPGQRVTLN